MTLPLWNGSSIEVGGCRDKELKNCLFRADNLLHGLQRCVHTHDIQLKEGNPEPLHEIYDGLGFPIRM